jgi:hypothetical protein
MNEAKAPSRGSVMPVTGGGLAFLGNVFAGDFFTVTL